MSWRTAASILDVEIEELQTRLQILRDKRNSITPIYQLPDDIMARILLMAQLDLPPNDARLFVNFVELWREPVDGLRKPSWVMIMSVCKRFREVALSSPVLWASIDLEGRKNCDWARLCRERTLGSSLDLNGFVNSSEIEVTDLTVDYFTDARRARIIITTSELQAFLDVSARLERRLSVSNPLLVDLEIANLDNPQFPLWKPPPIAILTSTLLGGTNVNLTSLCLTYVDWIDVPPMPLLKFLTLHGCVIDKSCRNVQSLLRQTPAVTYMALLLPKLVFDTDTPHEYTFPEDCPQANELLLPELLSLTLSGPLPPLALVLRVLPNPREYFYIKTVTHGSRQEHYEWLTQLDESFAAYVMTRLGEFMSEAARFGALLPHSAAVLTYCYEVIELHIGSINDHMDPYKSSVRCDLIVRSSAVALAQAMQHVRQLAIVYAEDLPSLSLTLQPCLHLDRLIMINIEKLALSLASSEFHTDDDITVQGPLTQQTECFESLMRTQSEAQRGPIPRLLLSYAHGHDLPSTDGRKAVYDKWKHAGWVESIEWEQSEQLI